MSDLKPSVIRAGKFEMVVDFTFSDLFDKVIRRFERPQNEIPIIFTTRGGAPRKRGDVKNICVVVV
ncbi:hypothetical protein IGI04_035496 [Brassica rapa subsp. trilocularis]|uniref:Uncharacterized protein n=2 Tax=Brassica campestris TaxID=3711 RepID=A0ABQ7LE26_BRACM|nr:hypothetical protein IGI04_035496 [Brassica rapa subsp. trilocularis]